MNLTMTVCTDDTTFGNLCRHAFQTVMVPGIPYVKELHFPLSVMEVLDLWSIFTTVITWLPGADGINKVLDPHLISTTTHLIVPR